MKPETRRNEYEFTMAVMKLSASASQQLRLVVVMLLLLSLWGSPVQTATGGSSTLRGSAQPVRRSPIFIFHSDEFWLNLHHFLYVLGRAQNKTRDSSREAVTFYAAGPSKKDLVFDDPLPALTIALAKANRSKLPVGVESTVAAILTRVAPIYRKTWWPRHRAANQAWQSAIQSLVKQHGDAILAFITRAYQMQWPAAGYGVHISAYANWAGAYSTEGNLLVVSSLNEGTQGQSGLETVFHEGMHQWDDQVAEILRTGTPGREVFAERLVSRANLLYRR
jgi:hypothetical protein